MVSSEFSKQVGILLKTFRIKNNLSIEELAEKSGVSVYKIKSIENFEHDIKFTTIFRLCEALNINLSSFVEMLE